MDSNTYQKQFGRTLAPVFFPENVNPLFLGMLLAGRSQTAKIIDASKRALFYNNTDRLGEYEGPARNDLNLPYHDEPEIIHAILGMEGEVTEVSDVVFDSNLTKDEKRAKIIDECGDTLWFMALLFKNFDITFEEVFAANIAKLAQRYPEKFSVEAAVNRDLEAESNVLQFQARRKLPVNSTSVLETQETLH